jgi:tocopherol O-methyltransferase
VIQPKSAAAVPNDVAAHYDELDPFYRAIWGTHVHHGYWETGRENTAEAVLNLTRFVATQAGIGPGIRVCDFGCGYGATAEYLEENYRASVTGITISRRQHAYAIARIKSDSVRQFLLADGLQNGLTAQSFDAFIAIESSEHISDKPKFLREAHRLLTSDGRLTIAAWLARESPHRWESKFLLEPICSEGRIANLPTAAEYLAMIEAAGFRDRQFFDLTPKVAKTWRLCALGFLTALCTDGALRRQFFQLDPAQGAFAKSVFRIWLAYHTGSMRYGVFSAHR